MFEKYTSRDGFEQHTCSDSYAAWSAFKETEPFSHPATVSFYNTVAAEVPVASSSSFEVASDATPFGAPPSGFAWGAMH